MTHSNLALALLALALLCACSDSEIKELDAVPAEDAGPNDASDSDTATTSTDTGSDPVDADAGCELESCDEDAEPDVVIDARTCLVDALEPNDTLEDATLAGTGADFAELQSCREDPDFFAVEVGAGQTLVVRVDADLSGREFGLVLRDPEGAFILATVGEPPRIERTLEREGRYLVRAMLNVGRPVAYALHIEVY